MRKFKEVKRKEIIYSLCEWKQIERAAAKVSMQTSEYIRRMSLNGEVTYLNMKGVDLLEKSKLSETEKIQLKMYGSLAERCNIHSRDELQRVENLRKDTSEKVERLNEQMKKCKQMHDTYASIADTYKKISEGDYISNLIAEKKREDEQKKNVTHKMSR